jgi:basic membrane protein A
MPSTINDLAFAQSMYDALLKVQTDMGGPDKMELVKSENVFTADDAAAAMRDYATQGYQLIIAHGSQYGSAVQQTAPDFPNTSFAWGTTVDTFGMPNVFAYEAASQEGGYVNGVVAANLSKSQVFGVIGPIETGDAKLYVDGFKAGVLATKPAAKVNVVYTNSFSDTALAAEAASTDIAAGADVLTGTAQMVVGAIGKAKESNVLWFGTQANQTSLAPSVVVASQVYHWEGALKQMIDAIQAGTLGGKTFTMNLANGGEVIEFNPGFALSADAKAAADATIKGISDGTIKITMP